MRTKTLLIAVAALAAAVTSSQAQSTVYSQNVVGYVNLSITNNTLQQVGNQLDTGSNTLDNVFPQTDAGLVSLKTVVLEWNGAGYNQYTYENCSDSPNALPGWYSGANEVGRTNLVNPGFGFFIHNTSAGIMTLPTVGQVVQGTNVYSVPVGLTMMSLPESLAGLPLDNTNINFPLVSLKTVYLTWNGGGYNQYTYENCSDSPDAMPGFYSGSTFEDTNASIWPQAGSGFFIRNTSSGTLTWTNIFQVQ